MHFRKFSELTSAHVEQLWALYQDEWWTRGRQLEDVRAMVSNSSLVYGYVSDAEALVGFGRVLTDRVYKALIFDVIVSQVARKQGLGVALMNWILHDPEIRNVKHFELYCAPEMNSFYERWGFSSDVGEISLMRRAV